MRNANRWIVATAGCLIVILVGQGLAQDWPQWRGAHRDARVSGFTAPTSWPSALTQKWKVTVGAGDSSPALVGNKIYVFTRQGDDEVVLCLNADSGAEAWRYKYAAPAVAGPSAKVHAGPRSSPAVADGKVVTLGVNGVLSCVDAASGKLLWQKDEFPKMTPKFYTATSPLVTDGMVIAQLGGEGNGAMMAFDLNTGEPRWKWAGAGTAYSSPALLSVDGSKQIVSLTDKSVVGVNLTDGALLWEIPFPAAGMSYNAATPIIEGATVIFTGQGRGTKAVQIEKKGDAFVPKELWSNDKLSVQFNTPVLKDGFLYGLTDKGFLFCLNAKTGEAAWTDTVKRGANFAAVVDVGAVLFALPNTSELIVFKPNDKAYEEAAKIKVADSATYAYPIVAGKRLFVKDQDALTLWTFE